MPSICQSTIKSESIWNLNKQARTYSTQSKNIKIQIVFLIIMNLMPLAYFSILWDARGLVVEVRLQQQHRCSLLMVPLAAQDVAVPAAVAGSWGAGPGLASLGEEANLQKLPGNYRL
jgi:hypothetical protein